MRFKEMVKTNHNILIVQGLEVGKQDLARPAAWFAFAERCSRYARGAVGHEWFRKSMASLSDIPIGENMFNFPIT